MVSIAREPTEHEREQLELVAAAPKEVMNLQALRRDAALQAAMRTAEVVAGISYRYRESAILDACLKGATLAEAGKEFEIGGTRASQVIKKGLLVRKYFARKILAGDYEVAEWKS